MVDAKSMDIDSVISWYQPSDVSAAIKEPPSEHSSTTKASKTTTTSTSTSTQTPSRFEAIELLKQLKETHPDLFQEFSETKPGIGDLSLFWSFTCLVINLLFNL